MSLIAKDRVFKLQLRAGKAEAEARELADAYSGHSLRAGYATTAGENDEPGYRILHRMRHKSMDTTGGYIKSVSSGRNQGSRGSGSEGAPQK